jgi:hypothetical protein
MSNICVVCGRTESEAIADANALGLRQEFQVGIYTCCQIAEWANEQAAAWFEALAQDFNWADEPAAQLTREPQPVFARPRPSRSRVPWYRMPNDQALY